MTTHYQSGANVERFVVDRARRHDCKAWRVAGSKGEGATDLLVASRWTGMLALNVKRGSWAPPAERIAMATLAPYGVLPVLVCAIVRNGIGTTLLFRELENGWDMGLATEVEPWSEQWLAR